MVFNLTYVVSSLFWQRKDNHKVIGKRDCSKLFVLGRLQPKRDEYPSTMLDSSCWKKLVGD